MALAKFIEVGKTNYSEVDDHYNIEQGDGATYPRQGEPPDYAARNSVSSLSGPSPSVLLLSIDFTAYRLQASTLSDDMTTRTTTDPGLTSNATALYKLLKEQATLPPRPVVRIIGTHIDHMYFWGTTRTDFDLSLDMMPLIMPTSTTRLTYINIKPDPEDNSLADPLKSWVQRFCNDPAEYKSLILERLVINWDTEFLQRKIRTAVLSTKYKGDLEITFPITNSRVVIAKDSPNLPSYTREYSAISGKQKWLGRTKPPLQVTDQIMAASSNDSFHTYHPMQAIWPYASSSPGAASKLQSNSLFSTAVEPQYAVQSEKDWWNVWKEPIKNGVLARKQGWLTVEDWKDVVLDQVRLPEPKKSWSTSTDDWHSLIKGMKLGGSQRGASGDIVKGMRYANSAGV